MLKNKHKMISSYLLLQFLLHTCNTPSFAFTIKDLRLTSQKIKTRTTFLGSSPNDNESPPPSSSNPFDSTTRNVATQVLQGTGPALTNLNEYNLPNFQSRCDEWTVNIVQKIDETQKTARLGAKNDRENYVDIVIAQFPRLDQQGIGIQLVELASGEGDIGITVVESLVENGPAATAVCNNSSSNDANDNLIQPGDSLSKVSIIRTYRNGNEEIVKEYTAQTECLSYEATVNAIQTLPPMEKNKNLINEYYSLSIKRIRRKPKVTIQLKYPPSQKENDTSITLYAGENLRYGMLLRDVKLNDPLAKRFDTKNGGNCGANGLCRTCAISVVKGEELLNPQRLAETQILKDSPRWRLGCKAIVGFGMREGEMIIRVNPRQWE